MEEVGMTNMMQVVQAKLEDDEEFKKMTDEEKEQRIRDELFEQSKKVTFKQIEINSMYEGELPEIPEIFFKATNMKELRDHLKTMKETKYKLKNDTRTTGFGFGGFGGFGTTFRTSVKEVKMELCDDDDFEEYETQLEVINKMEEEIPEFKEGEEVRIREKGIDSARTNKLLERLKKRMMK